MPHHRRAQGQATAAASHEDTSLGHAWRKRRSRHPRTPATLAPCRQAELCSADRRPAKLRFAERGTLCLPPACPPRSHHNSLFTLQSTRRRGRPRRCRAIFSERPRTPTAPAGGGGERIRTDDLLLAKQALSQLSYTPFQPSRDQKTEVRDQICSLISGL